MPNTFNFYHLLMNSTKNVNHKNAMVKMTENLVLMDISVVMEFALMRKLGAVMKENIGVLNLNNA